MRNLRTGFLFYRRARRGYGLTQKFLCVKVLFRRWAESPRILPVREGGQPSKPFTRIGGIVGNSVVEEEMDKIKFGGVVLFFTAVIGLLGWGIWSLLDCLGFWKSAAAILAIEFFFVARGSYLVVGTLRGYQEEVEAFRFEIMKENSVPFGGVSYDKNPQGKARTIYRRFVVAALLFTVGFGLSYAFGFLILCPFLVFGVLALTIRWIYQVRLKIIGNQQVLEDLRLMLVRKKDEQCVSCREK